MDCEKKEYISMQDANIAVYTHTSHLWTFGVCRHVYEWLISSFHKVIVRCIRNNFTFPLSHTTVQRSSVDNMDQLYLTWNGWLIPWVEHPQTTIHCPKSAILKPLTSIDNKEGYPDIKGFSWVCSQLHFHMYKTWALKALCVKRTAKFCS